MAVGSVRFTVPVFAVVGVPAMGTVTTVPLVRDAVPAESPAGSPDTAAVKSVAVIEAAYVPLVSV
jgi:hypothetical protein